MQFIYAGDAHDGNAFAFRVFTETNAQSSPAVTKYYHFDQLRSVTAVSDEFGRVVTAAWAGGDATQYGYDAWGARRNPDETSGQAAVFATEIGHRGFTSQETIPGVGLINMNGRVYDPALGRFLTPDPNVQFENDLQSYNRYSYVLNNPLRYSDPTGYFSWSPTATSIITSLAITIVAGGACAVTGGGGCVLIGILAAAESAAVMRAEGASWGQIVVSSEIGFMAGQLGGGLGELVTGGGTSAGAQFAGAIVGGAVGGAVGSVLSTMSAGGSLGWNVLEGAAQGAAWGAVGWSLRPLGPATKADAPAGQGGGAAGSAELERMHQFLAAGGYKLQDPSGWDTASPEEMIDQLRAERADPMMAKTHDEGLAEEFPNVKVKVGLGGALAEGIGLSGFAGIEFNLRPPYEPSLAFDFGVLRTGAAASVNFGSLSSGAVNVGTNSYNRFSSAIGPFSAKLPLANADALSGGLQVKPDGLNFGGGLKAGWEVGSRAEFRSRRWWLRLYNPSIRGGRASRDTSCKV